MQRTFIRAGVGGIALLGALSVCYSATVTFTTASSNGNEQQMYEIISGGDMSVGTNEQFEKISVNAENIDPGGYSNDADGGTGEENTIWNCLNPEALSQEQRCPAGEYDLRVTLFYYDMDFEPPLLRQTSTDYNNPLEVPDP